MNINKNKNNRRNVDYLNIVNTIIFIVMVTVVLSQVFFRYVLRVSVPWTEEFARYLLIFITFLGGALAVRDKKHISINVIIDRLPKKIFFYLNKFFDLAIIIFLFIVVKGSIIMINLTWETPLGSIRWLTRGKLYLILPISMGIMIICLIYRLANERLDENIQNGKDMTK